MRWRMLWLITVVLGTACGRELGISSLAAVPEPATICLSDGSGGAPVYRAQAYKTSTLAFSHVTLEVESGTAPGRALRLGDYRDHDDLTPAGPTDLNYRWRYYDRKVIDSGYAVTLTNGGFTGLTTATVTHETISTTLDVTTMTCDR